MVQCGESVRRETADSQKKFQETESDKGAVSLSAERQRTVDGVS